jgi:hypothetical protein
MLFTSEVSSLRNIRTHHTLRRLRTPECGTLFPPNFGRIIEVGFLFVKTIRDWTDLTTEITENTERGIPAGIV